MKNISNFAFKMEIKGSNVVNYAVNNHNEAVAHLNNYGGENFDLRNSNYKIPNLVWENLDTPITRYHQGNNNNIITTVQTQQHFLAISSECLRHAIFGIKYDSKNLVNLKPYYVQSLVLLNRLSRGYQDTNTSGDTYHKKSGLSIGQAEDRKAVVTFNVHTHSDVDAKSNSLYVTGDVGKTHYFVDGFININEFSMLVADAFFGQMEIPQSVIDKEGGENLLDEAFMAVHGRIPYTKGYYYYSSSTSESKKTAQYGCHFDHEFQIMILKDLLKRMLNVNIQRANANATATKFLIRPIANAKDANVDNENGFIEVEDEEWIDNIEENLAALGYEIKDLYLPANAEEVLGFRDDYNKANENQKEAKEAEKAAEKKRKQEYKERKQKEEAEKLAKAAIEADTE